VGARPHGGIDHFGGECERHAETARPPLENAEQLLPAQAGEAVAGRLQDFPPVVDIDVIPVCKRLGDLGMGDRVGFQKIVQSGVGKDDTEAESVVGAVALDDGDLVPGIGPLHQDREIQARRAAADRDDLHACDCTEAGTVNGPVSAYDGHEEGVMKTPACLPTLVSALVLMLVVGVALPSAVMAGDPLGTPARPDSGTYRDRDVPARDPAAPTVQQNEPNRANYFVDYHAKPEATGTGG